MLDFLVVAVILPVLGYFVLAFLAATASKTLYWLTIAAAAALLVFLSHGVGDGNSFGDGFAPFLAIVDWIGFVFASLLAFAFASAFDDAYRTWAENDIGAED